MMTTINETPDPDRIDDLQDTNLQNGPDDIGEQDPEQLVGDELTPEEIAALEQEDTGPEGAIADFAPDEPGADEGPQGEIGRERRRWYLAPCLGRLLFEVNRRWPRRDRTGDRTILPSSRGDHYPNSRGSVNACDIDKDGVRVLVIVRAAIRHPSCNYIIFNGVIWLRSRNFRPFRLKGGFQAYRTRIHISIIPRRTAEQSRTRWGIWPRLRRP
ncbi:hypothetical protein [Massilia scottii]|uniref:hypothetical protein n=2 Tax=Massilia scottii TaxID=3057166 RepID=UPI002796766B|nr:hypothetical protein [Massilia sp. CCM 9029]MDQ1832500.1 hypothetical protein [Massilia sp. CCM 9029]